jgi:hypothetical protein
LQSVEAEGGILGDFGRDLVRGREGGRDGDPEFIDLPYMAPNLDTASLCRRRGRGGGGRVTGG